ncbi:MAG: Hsp20/alpha crystallin family protein [Phycisphaerae bacterium]
MAFLPFQETPLSLSNLQDEMNRLFERIWHAGLSTRPFDGQKWAPVVDLHEHPDHYTLYAEVPGVDGSSIELSYLDPALTIRGEKTRPAGVSEEDRPLRGERRFGTFCRMVELPAGINADNLSAKCQAGVLEITIPKSESSRPKAIKVEVVED